MSYCEAGWHVRGDPADPTYFRFGVRIGGSPGTFVYRFGPAPDDRVCRTIWCYGDRGIPWTCRDCGQPIDSPLFPLSRLAKRRHDRGGDQSYGAGSTRTSWRLRPPFSLRLAADYRGRAPRI